VSARRTKRRVARRRAHAQQAHDTPGEWLNDKQAVPLLWRPWYLDQLESPDGAIWAWSFVQNACALPDPAAFPTFAARWSPETSAMMSRYLAIVERLLATNVMNAGASIKVDLLTGGVTKSVPADDATLGFAALLRQLFNDSEEASFDRVRKAAGRAAHEDEASDAGTILAAWKRAHQTLLSRHLDWLIHQLADDAGLLDEDDDPEPRRRRHTQEVITPRELIEVFLYGDMLHWGDGRERLRRWAATPRGHAHMEFEMRNDAHVLAHFYAGFAAIIQQLSR
jgi:hypothetical protein